jgi:saccharopine dehydrogenase-like NADP-dependent oxidoreductase
MKTVGIVGKNNISRAVGSYLRSSNFDVHYADSSSVEHDSKRSLNYFVADKDLLISAERKTNHVLAELCDDVGRTYFDLGNDKSVIDKSHAKNSFIMPCCGVSPGITDIIAEDMIKGFDSVDSVKIRTGHLPDYLISESDYQNNLVFINGVMYESYTTSDDILNSKDIFDYKHIRYPGQQNETINFGQDSFIILVNVNGMKNNKLVNQYYFKRIKGDNNFNAQERSTASSICAIVLMYCINELSGNGIIKPSDVNFDLLQANKFGQVFKK